MSDRPAYMLIFNQSLQRHNEAQPKFVPQRRPILAPLGIDGRSLTHSNAAAGSSDSSLASQLTTSLAAKQSMTVQRMAQSSVQSARRFGSLPMPQQQSGPVLVAERPLPNVSLPLLKGFGKQVLFKDSAPSVAQTPAAVLGNSGSLPQEGRSTATAKARVSMARTIAEQTPNAFKTLGPGFNRNAPTEKSFNISGRSESGTLASTIMPSDYEHIFHAPSQIVELPHHNTSEGQQARNHEKRKNDAETATK